MRRSKTRPPDSCFTGLGRLTGSRKWFGSVEPTAVIAIFPIPCAAALLIFFIAGLLYLLRFKGFDNLGAYRIPPETGLLIPSVYNSFLRSFPPLVAGTPKSAADRFVFTSAWTPLADFPLNTRVFGAR